MTEKAEQTGNKTQIPMTTPNQEQERIIIWTQLIIEFDGTPEKYINKPILDWAHYHSSWDWQIPVYSKLVKAIRESVTATPKILKLYGKMRVDYENSVLNNDLLSGFNTIVDNLTWYNQNKKA